MKHIVSYKMKTRDLGLEKLIDFHSICLKSDNQLFLYQNGKACRIHRMTELVLFVLTAKEDEVLVVVEGEKAHLTLGRMIKCLYGNGACTKEARSI